MKKSILQISSVIFLLVLVYISIFLYACQNEKEPVLEAIIVAKQPTKVDYQEGEFFDKTGLVINGLFDDESSKVIEDYTIDLINALTINNKVVTISYQNFTTVININVTKKNTPLTITDVEIKVEEGKTYIRTMDIASLVSYREVFSDGTVSEWATCVNDDLVDLQIEDGQLCFTVSLYIQNREYNKKVTIPVDDNSISISEFIQKSVDDKIYVVNGLLVGVATTITKVEYLVMDKDTQEIIGITGLDGGGKINTYELDMNGFEVGDELIIPVKMSQTIETENNSNSLKKYGVYAGGASYEMGIVSRNNTYELKKDGAITLSNQNDLISFLTSPQRLDNYYQLVKLHGEINFIYYAGENGNTKHYRFFFDNVTNYTEQKIEGNCSPCFSSGAEYYTIGKSIGELLFNQDEFAPTDWANPAKVVKDIYALFIGGNNYYHEFVILNENDVQDIENTLKSCELTPPNTLVYPLNSSFDLTGAHFTLNYEFGNPVNVEVTEEMITSIPDMSTSGKKEVQVNYNNSIYKFEITVDEKNAVKVELVSPLLKTSYSFMDGIEAVKTELEKLKLKVSYSNDTFEDIDISSNMITCDTPWDVGKLIIKINYMDNSTEITIDVIMQSIDVTTVKGFEVGDTEYDLSGIIIGAAYISGTVAAPANGEVLIKDKNTNDVIGVRNLDLSVFNTDGNISIGDEILVRAKLIIASTNTNHSEEGKLVAQAVNPDNVVVISKDNNISLDFTNATNILCQDDLVEFLKDENIRKGNAYSLIKLGAGASIVNYNLETNSSYITFTGINSATSKIDGLAPYLHEMNEKITLGTDTYLRLLFGEDAQRNTNYGVNNEGNVLDKDVYLMYIGGQGSYYHQFILLGKEYVCTDASKNLLDVTLTSPTKVLYTPNSILDLTGGSLNFSYYYTPQNEIVYLSDIIDTSTIDMTKVGNQTIKFTYDNKEYSFDILISEATITNIEVETMPTKTIYMVHDTVDDIDLTNGIIKVNYSDGSSINIDMTREMLTYTGEVKEYLIGDVEYTLTYKEVSTTLKFTHRALTITEFLDLEVGTIAEIEGIVVGPVNSSAAIEILIKDKNSNNVIGIYNTGLAGTAAEPALNTSIINIGDEIIASVKRASNTTEGAHQGKYYANGINGTTFQESLIVVSHNNSVDVDLTNIEYTTISSTEELTSFLNNSSRFYSYVKLSGVKAITYQKDGSVNVFYRLFFDGVTSLSTQKVNNSSPVFILNNCETYLENDITSYFSKATSTDYNDPLTTEYDIYAIFVGGNSYYQDFIILSDTWLIK